LKLKVKLHINDNFPKNILQLIKKLFTFAAE